MIGLKLKEQFLLNNTFAVYRKPNENLVFGLFQESDDLSYVTDYEGSGFVFAPFDDTKPSVLIPFRNSKFIKEDFSEILTDVDIDNDSIIDKDCRYKESDEKHIAIVDRAVEEIKSDKFDKLVISRQEIVDLSFLDVYEIYLRLLKKYPTAFVYIWFHPKIGLWLGATPETLVQVSGNEFRTMSLAGTQVYQGTTEVFWEDKELKEQKFVTDFILDKITHKCSSLKVEPLETIRAGNLVHLQTKITGKLNSTITGLIEELHPTPAVCGLPKEDAKQFILNNEGYDREFYTGFLGELNYSGLKGEVHASSLFVNLRCMKIEGNRANIFVGGGITKDSISQKEFNETVEKSKVMKSVL